MKEYFIETVKHIVTLLVAKDIQKVVNETNGYFSEERLGEVLSEYPGQISMPPDQAFENIYFFKVSHLDTYIVEFNLWYDDEDSDLKLTLKFDPPFSEAKKCILYGLEVK